MDTEEAAFASAKEKHNKYMVYGKKNRYIEVFQCSGDDMNLVLNGGGLHSPVNQRKSSPLLSHGMLQAPPQPQQQSQPQATATQSIPSALTIPQHMALSNLSINRPHASATNAALIAQQHAHLIAQHNLLTRQQQAASAAAAANQQANESQYFMSNYLMPTVSAATSALHSANAGVQSPLIHQTNHAMHVSTANSGQISTTQTYPSSLVQTAPASFLYMSRNAANMPSAAAAQLPSGMQSAAAAAAAAAHNSMPYAGLPSNFQNFPNLQFASSGMQFMPPYANQVLLSPHSLAAAHNSQLAAFQLRSSHQAQQGHTPFQPSLSNAQLMHANQYLQSTLPKPIMASPNSYQLPNQLSVNTNAASASTLMQHAASIKRSYESAFHHDPSATLHSQKRQTPHLY